jgi:hypothetical protein
MDCFGLTDEGFGSLTIFSFKLLHIFYFELDYKYALVQYDVLIAELYYVKFIWLTRKKIPIWFSSNEELKNEIVS